MAYNVYYFDESSGWTDRKPSSLPNIALKTITVCNVDFSRIEVTEVDKFNELLMVHSPTVAVIHSVSPSTLYRIKNFSATRKGYALLETSRVALHEEGTIVLLRLGLQGEPTELTAKSEGKNLLRTLLQVPARIPGGPALSITILNMEHSVPIPRRLQIAGTLLKPSNNTNDSTISMLISNVVEGFDHNDEMYRELQNTRNSYGFVDMLEDAPEKNFVTPWAMWMKSIKFAPTSPYTEMMRGQEPRFLVCSIATRNATATPTIAIPMPRSAKTGRTKSPPSSLGAPVGNQVLTDPAILSAEAAKTSSLPASQGNDFFSRFMRQQDLQQPHATHQKWKLSHSFSLKGSDSKLSNAENIFDLTNLFSSPTEAVDALNSKLLNWPADFCVVHNTVLCSDAVAHNDRQAFRRYARDVKGNITLTSQIYAANSAFANAVTHNNHTPESNKSANAWVKPSRVEMEEFTAFQRQVKRDETVRREWHESCCTIVYQLTPSEMNKFNITPLLGLGKDNLKKTVYYLNHAKSNLKDNPLQDYAYDYALLFSVERQGYWLIAATHVPCDIVACRMVA